MRYKLMLGAALGALAMTSGQAFAADAAVAETTDANDVEAIVVYGAGQSRQVQSIQGAELLQAAPGTSPIKLVDKLPGVNFQSADAFGAYEWSTRISIRGFNQNQLGFTLDGVPLGDMSYGAFNGLHISRAIVSEDIGRVELAQGSGGLDTASTSNLGGTLKFVSRDPSATFGAIAALTYGSEDTTRAYVRLDSGEILGGLRASVSYADQSGDKWKGDGSQKQRQADFKAVLPIGEGSLTGFVNWSQRRENDYQDLSLGMIKRLGYGWDNISGNWPLAVQLADIGNNRGDTGAPPTNPGAGTVYPAPFASIDDAYYDAAGLRNDTLWGMTLKTPLGDIFSVDATLYGHRNEGQGLWFTPYVPSPNAYTPGATTANAPLSIRTTEYEINRYGVTGSVTAKLGVHQFEAGLWYEDNVFDQARRFYALNRASPGRDSLKFQSDPFATQWAYRFKTYTNTYYLQDTISLGERLTINLGAKGVNVRSRGETLTGAPVINGSIKSADAFLPQAGFNWKAADWGEVFGSYTENMRAFGAAHTGLSPFATTQEGFAAIQNTLKPETSKTFELGLRFRTDTLQGVVAVYHVTFEDRLLGSAAGAGIVGNPTILYNVGGVTANGIETAATWDFAPHWSLFGSYAYNDSTYDDDVTLPAPALPVATAGKTTVDTPQHLLKVELGYDNGAFFAKAGAHYTSKRYFTYTNDQSVPGYTLVDLSAGYRFNGEGWSKGLEIQVNVTNLFDKEYVSTIGSNGFGNAGDAQTLLAGAPRQAFVTVRKGF